MVDINFVGKAATHLVTTLTDTFNLAWVSESVGVYTVYTGFVDSRPLADLWAAAWEPQFKRSSDNGWPLWELTWNSRPEQL